MSDSTARTARVRVGSTRFAGVVCTLVSAALLPLGMSGPAAATDPVVVSQSEARSFSPNGDGQEDTFPIAFSLSVPASVTITIETTGGTTIAELEHLFPRPAGYHSISWDGIKNNGVQAGNAGYRWRVTATPDGGGSAQSVTGDLAVDDRKPGSVTAPTPAADVSGPTVTAKFQGTVELPGRGEHGHGSQL